MLCLLTWLCNDRNESVKRETGPDSAMRNGTPSSNINNSSTAVRGAFPKSTDDGVSLVPIGPTFCTCQGPLRVARMPDRVFT